MNHATSRVNESEHERALSEAEHRHTTALYHKAEHEVQRLQRELKRTIAKSRYVRDLPLTELEYTYFPNGFVIMHEIIAYSYFFYMNHFGELKTLYTTKLMYIRTR